MKSNREEFASEKTNKVLLDKFISYCNKVFMEVFNRNDNFQISLDEYKLILSNMGCINPNSQLAEDLVKESFNNYLKPNEDKVDIHSFLVLGLAALGIYKGNDEPKKLQLIQIQMKIEKVLIRIIKIKMVKKLRQKHQVK